MSGRRYIVSEDKYKGKNLTYEEYKGLKELTWWIEDNVFKFDDTEGLSKTEGEHLSHRITDLIKKGYTYEEILNTLKFVNMDIQYSFKNLKFNDYRHKINFIFKKIMENIDDMRERMERVKSKQP